MLSAQRQPIQVEQAGLLPRDLGDEFLFYDSERDRVHVLNGTARAIYMMCDGARSEVEVAARFGEIYGLDPATAQRDTEEALARLTELGLIRPEPVAD